MRYRLAASVGISYMSIVDREPPLSLEEKDKVKNMVFEKIKIVPVVRDHEMPQLGFIESEQSQVDIVEE